MPNEFLRDRLQRKLAGLPDERLYQVLDFVEFLETKYAEPAPAASTNFFQRFAEGVEDRLRAGKVNTSTIAEAMNLMHRAAGVIGGVAAAGRSVATDVADGVTKAATVATSVAGAAADAAAKAAQGVAPAPCPLPQEARHPARRRPAARHPAPPSPRRRPPRRRRSSPPSPPS